MIVEYIRYRIADERRVDFENAYARAADALSRSPHCVDYELSRSVEEPACYVLRITWTAAEDHLRGFRGGELFPAFFAAIKDYVGDIEEMRHYERTAVRGQGASVPSLYRWAGGQDALERLTEVFYGLVAKDELVGPLFAQMDPAHPRHVALWLGEVFGGPDGYTRHRGGYRHMLGQHLGKAITEAQRRRWVGLLLDAAEEVGLPDDPEFRAAFVGYLEWGTRLAVQNSRAGAAPAPDAPVPRWGWGSPRRTRAEPGCTAPGQLPNAGGGASRRRRPRRVGGVTEVKPAGTSPASTGPAPGRAAGRCRRGAAAPCPRSSPPATSARTFAAAFAPL